MEEGAGLFGQSDVKGDGDKKDSRADGLFDDSDDEKELQKEKEKQAKNEKNK